MPAGKAISLAGAARMGPRCQLRFSRNSSRTSERTRVVSIHLARDHVPHALVHLATDLHPHATLISEARAEDISKVVVLRDGEVEGVVALEGERVFGVGHGGVADLVCDGVGLSERSD